MVISWALAAVVAASCAYVLATGTRGTPPGFRAVFIALPIWAVARAIAWTWMDRRRR